MGKKKVNASADDGMLRQRDVRKVREYQKIYGDWWGFTRIIST